MPCSLYLSVSAAPNPALCVVLFGSASRSTTPTGMSSTTNMRLTLVTSECCQGKEDKKKKNTLTDTKSENVEVKDQSLCKTTLQLNMYKRFTLLTWLSAGWRHAVNHCSCVLIQLWYFRVQPDFPLQHNRCRPDVRNLYVNGDKASFYTIFITANFTWTLNWSETDTFVTIFSKYPWNPENINLMQEINLALRTDGSYVILKMNVPA